MNNLSERLKELRTKLGLNLSEFAKKMDTKHQNIMVIEAGTSKPGAEILSRISETYSVNLNWLVNGKGDMFEGGKTPELTTQTLPKRLEFLRKTLNVNVADFAKKTEISYQNINNFESGKAKPGQEMLEKIALATNVHLDWLVLGEGEMFKNGKTPELAVLPIKEKKEVKTVVGNEIVDVSFWQRMLDIANKEKADLIQMLQSTLLENKRLNADMLRK